MKCKKQNGEVGKAMHIQKPYLNPRGTGKTEEETCGWNCMVCQTQRQVSQRRIEE